MESQDVRPEKPENLNEEMDKCDVSILDLSEAKWSRQGNIVCENYSVLIRSRYC